MDNCLEFQRASDKYEKLAGISDTIVHYHLFSKQNNDKVRDEVFGFFQGVPDMSNYFLIINRYSYF